ncbi:von Willebrand factor A domain-containing protein 3B-like [Octopus sinensis]|uniref:von Willebrand factor A domain-containing protein 3B-like n=1 Tax=Octopus sinensis TaxID=2607531 RepID=A0A6P7TTK1_9MOLL|nr:von Willebrand factor A domain-containing protein 3B-like [Octopus sinensis]
MHVHVTNDIYRDYQSRLNVVMDRIINRLNWLKETSYYYFGRIIESRIFILVDISLSMKEYMKNVYKLLFRVLNEQILNSGKSFNIIAFNTEYHIWRNNFTFPTPGEIKLSLNWLKSIEIGGSTNIIPPLTNAIYNNATETVFLLSDGRSNESVDEILSSLSGRHNLRINTISFNMDNSPPNRLLYELSFKTSGVCATFVLQNHSRTLRV